MKKLSALVALVLCVTIGGVYAAWMYTGNELLAIEERMNHSLEVPEFKTRVGVLEVKENTVKIRIDQKAEKDYTAELKVTGQIVVRFTVNPGAPDQVVLAGVPCEAVLDMRNVDKNLYKDSPIYKYNNNPVEIQWNPVEGTPGVFEAAITYDQIDRMLDLGAEFTLPTYEDYTEFNELLNNIVLNLKVQPVVTETPVDPAE